MRGEIFAILDRSGSMSNCVDETIRGYNRFLDNQKEEGSGWKDMRLTTALFDDRYEVLVQACPLLDTLPLTDRAYFVRGSTALFDAIGKTLLDANTRLEAKDPADRPERVVVLIITDGQENASTHYTAADVKRLIDGRKNAGWEFFFLGAELENFDDAHRIGIDPARQAGFEKGMSEATYQRMSKTIKGFMKTGKVEDGWGDDFKKGGEVR
jgi:uncharacterized protein YegL